MRVRVLLFGPERAAAGVGEVRVELPRDGGTCADLRREMMAGAGPGLAAMLPAARFAVNHAFVADAHVLKEGDEVALIGMVSGG